MDQTTNVRTGNDAVAGLQRESASLRAAAELKSSAAADLKAASEAQQAVAEASASLVEQVSAGVESLDDVKRRLKAFQERVALESGDLYRAVEEQQKRISELQALIVDGVSEKLSPHMRDMLQARAEKERTGTVQEEIPHDEVPARDPAPVRVPETQAVEKDESVPEKSTHDQVEAKVDLSEVPYKDLLAEFAKRQAEAETRQGQEAPVATAREEPAPTPTTDEPAIEEEPVPSGDTPLVPDPMGAGDLDGLGDLEEPETVDEGDPDVTTVIHRPEEADVPGGEETQGLADEDGAFGPAPLNTGTGAWQPSGGFGGAAFRADWAEQEAGAGDARVADREATGGIDHVDRSDLSPQTRKQLEARGY